MLNRLSIQYHVCFLHSLPPLPLLSLRLRNLAISNLYKTKAGKFHGTQQSFWRFKFRQLFLIGIEKIKIKRKFQNWSIKKNLKFNLLLGVLFSIERSSLNFFPRKAMTCLLPEWSVPEMEKNGTKSWDLPKGSGKFETGGSFTCAISKSNFGFKISVSTFGQDCSQFNNIIYTRCCPE